MASNLAHKLVNDTDTQINAITTSIKGSVYIPTVMSALYTLNNMPDTVGFTQKSAAALATGSGTLLGASFGAFLANRASHVVMNCIEKASPLTFSKLYAGKLSGLTTAFFTAACVAGALTGGIKGHDVLSTVVQEPTQHSSYSATMPATPKPAP